MDMSNACSAMLPVIDGEDLNAERSTTTALCDCNSVSSFLSTLLPKFVFPMHRKSQFTTHIPVDSTQTAYF